MNRIFVFVFLSTALAAVLVNGQRQRSCPSNMIQLFNGITCQRDEQCQNLANGFFCYQGYCCSNSRGSQSGYGASCTYNSQCRFQNSECRNNICYCDSGYSFNGNQCTRTSTSPITGDCVPGQVSINSVCYLVAGYFGDCVYSQQCAFGGAECVDAKCICQVGRIFDGDTCIVDPDAQSPPAVSGPICTADEIPVYGACYPSVGRGQSCTYDEQCILEVGLICQNGFCVDRKFGDPPIGDGTEPLYPVGPGPYIGDGTEPLYPYPYRPGQKVTICCYNTNRYPCCLSCCQTYNVVQTVPVNPIQPGPWIPPPPPYNPNQGNCGQNQVQVNGQCWPTSRPGGSCTFNLQCTDPYANKPLTCSRGVCRWVTTSTPTCQNRNAPVERINGVVKNCLYQDCTSNYRCEYNRSFNNGQYICCGTTFNDTPGSPPGTSVGEPKFNPGQSRPLECQAVNACTYTDYPHCVYSQRYRYQVCCSTRYCQ